MISAREALERLREGNQRFVAGVRDCGTGAGEARRRELLGGQHPFAVILGCADSRVPVELIFDQGLGDLFVIRVAGNIAAPSQIGSAEYAADHLGTPLVVVLGHSRCGAVTATLENLDRPAEGQSPHLSSIVERIRPAVESLLDDDSRGNPDAVAGRAVRANTCAAVRQLNEESEVLGRLVKEGKLLIVGAEYSLETGTVEFYEPADPAE